MACPRALSIHEAGAGLKAESPQRPSYAVIPPPIATRHEARTGQTLPRDNSRRNSNGDLLVARRELLGAFIGDNGVLAEFASDGASRLGKSAREQIVLIAN